MSVIYFVLSKKKLQNLKIQNLSIAKLQRVTIIEEGVDVWFALEAYEIATFRNFDYVILIIGDADHEMLIRKLKAIKIKPILLTWNFAEQTSTARLLREEAYIHWEIGDFVQKDQTILQSLLTNYKVL